MDKDAREANLRCVVEHGIEAVPSDELEASVKWACVEIDRLREALEWYAAPINRDTYHIITVADRTFLSDMADWGNRARAALAPADGRAEQ